MNATNTNRYQNVHKMELYFRDSTNGKLYFSSTDFDKGYALNRKTLTEHYREDFYVRVRLPRNADLSKIELLTNADPSGIHLHSDGRTCDYAYGILTYNISGNKNRPTGAPDFKQHGGNTSVKFDKIEFVSNAPSSGSLVIEGVSRELQIYTPSSLSLTNSPAGSRKVILRKVDSTYASVSGKTFTIYMGSSSTPYTPKGETSPLSGLPSGASGCFWIGDLPYGWYILEETSLDPHAYFYLVVTANGVFEGPAAAGGTTDRIEAETEAAEVYTANK